MSGFITSAGADYLMALFSGVSDVVPEYWVALVTEPVGTNEAGEELVEPTAADYARVAISVGPENWAVAYGTATNTTAIAFPVPGVEDWTGIVGWAICDAATEGNVLYAGDTDPYDVVVGDQTNLPAGSISLSVELDGWRETT